MVKCLNIGKSIYRSISTNKHDCNFLKLSRQSCLWFWMKQRETQRSILTSWCSHGTAWYQTAGYTKAVGETAWKQWSSVSQIHTHCGHINASQLWENFFFYRFSVKPRNTEKSVLSNTTSKTFSYHHHHHLTLVWDTKRRIFPWGKWTCGSVSLLSQSVW